MYCWSVCHCRCGHCTSPKMLQKIQLWGWEVFFHVCHIVTLWQLVSCFACYVWLCWCCFAAVGVCFCCHWILVAYLQPGLKHSDSVCVCQSFHVSLLFVTWHERASVCLHPHRKCVWLFSLRSWHKCHRISHLSLWEGVQAFFQPWIRSQSSQSSCLSLSGEVVSWWHVCWHVCFPCWYQDVW